jgi:hypothetical protein
MLSLDEKHMGGIIGLNLYIGVNAHEHIGL